MEIPSRESSSISSIDSPPLIVTANRNIHRTESLSRLLGSFDKIRITGQN